MLRVIYGNTPYIEGWAVYTEHMMEAAGVNAGDPVKMHLTALKGMLRIYMNTIIDVRLHTMNLPGDSAVAMMMREAFQERPEAVAKLQRAQLDYVQLMTYMAGVEEWTNLRRDVEKKKARDSISVDTTIAFCSTVPFQFQLFGNFTWRALRRLPRLRHHAATRSLSSFVLRQHAASIDDSRLEGNSLIVRRDRHMKFRLAIPAE